LATTGLAANFFGAGAAFLGANALATCFLTVLSARGLPGFAGAFFCGGGVGFLELLFLTGLAVFFFVAIVLGFFSNKYF
jgi:hypothetical protein